MEQRLFAVACVMYAFTLLTRYLKKKEKLSTSMAFGVWHGSFLLVILLCALYVLLFLLGEGSGDPVGLGKVVLWLCVALASSCWYWYLAWHTPGGKEHWNGNKETRYQVYSLR